MSSIDHQPIVESAQAAPSGQLDRRVFACASEADTARVAQALAAQPTVAACTLTLHGDLGAGKTTFVRHLLRALGVSGRIKSPTYAIVEPHQTPAGLLISHFDFYRFNDPREWEDAGFREVFAAPGLKLVEWPEKAHGLLPRTDLALEIDTLADEARTLTLKAYTATGLKILQDIDKP